jgi:hypothetical protein
MTKEITVVLKVVRCPLVDWYELTQCQITTCKNHTNETEHCCLEIDRKKPEGTKQFSDAELNLYKFKGRKISTRLVQIHRKNAVQSVKSILVLRKFIEWIADSYKPGAKFNNPDMKQIERSYPLRIKRLGWKNWMWEYVLDDQAWTKFSSKTEGECSSFEVYNLLGIKLGRYEELVQQFKQPKYKGSNHGIS